MNAATRKYLIEFGSAMALYSGSLFAMPTLLDGVSRDGALVWLVALIPVVPTGLVVYAIVRHYRRMDELHKRILGEVSFVAASLTIFASFAYGFLEAFASAPRLPVIWLTPAFFALWFPIGVIVRRRYQ